MVGDQVERKKEDMAIPIAAGFFVFLLCFRPNRT
jgi:hypothetical protein